MGEWIVAEITCGTTSYAWHEVEARGFGEWRRKPDGRTGIASPLNPTSRNLTGRVVWVNRTPDGDYFQEPS